METDVHRHSNNALMSSKPAADSWAMPPALLHYSNASPRCSSLGHPRAHTWLLTSLCDFFPLFLSPFQSVWALHSLMWPLSQLPSCLPALSHLFCLLAGQKPHVMWPVGHYAGLVGSQLPPNRRDGPCFPLSRGTNNFLSSLAMEFYIEAKRVHKL